MCQGGKGINHSAHPTVFYGGIGGVIGAFLYEQAAEGALNPFLGIFFPLLGCLLGVCVVYAVDTRKLNFQTDAIWWAQILKAVLGLGVVLLVKEGTKPLLEWMFNGHLVSRAVRYCLVVIAAGIVWPLSFRWFAKLGKKEK